VFGIWGLEFGIFETMVITFYGEGCFKLQSADFVVLIDPFDSQTGLTPPRFKSNIVLKTLTPLPLTNSLINQSTNQLIVGPGEYHFNNIVINGFFLTKESSEKFLKTIYLAKMEDITLCFLGHISEMPEPAILEHLEEVDILFIPAGGSPFIKPETAIKIIKQIEPKIVIPTFFKVPGLKRAAGKPELFLEEFNGKKTERTENQEKLTIKKKDLAEIKKTEIVLLNL